MNIFIIGYRCTGKTSVGKFLAEALGWTFIDADDELVAEQGQSISDLVSKHGWDTFRKIEHNIIKRLCCHNDCVVATGGGAVLDEANVKYMKKSGILVWLTATPKTITNRMLDDSRTRHYRPALTAKDLADEVAETLVSRSPYYKKAMDFSIDTDHAGVDEVCRNILTRIEDFGISLN